MSNPTPAQRETEQEFKKWLRANYASVPYYEAEYNVHKTLRAAWFTAWQAASSTALLAAERRGRVAGLQEAVTLAEQFEYYGDGEDGQRLAMWIRRAAELEEGKG